MSDGVLTASRRDVGEWTAGLRARASAGYLALGGVAPAGADALADADLSRMVVGGSLLPGRTLLDYDGAQSATVLVGDVEDRGTDRYIVFDIDAADLDAADVTRLRAALVAEAESRGRECTFSVPGFNATASAVARGGPHHLVATRMWLPLPAVSRVDPPIELAPMSEDEFARFREHLIEGFAQDLRSSGAADVDAALDASRAQTDALLPDGARTAGHYLLSARASGPVGLLWLFVGSGPAGTYGFVYDVEVDEGHRGRGLGRAIMEGASRLASGDGAQYVGLNVFGFNDVARSLYASMGYGIEGEFITATA